MGLLTCKDVQDSKTELEGAASSIAQIPEKSYFHQLQPAYLCFSYFFLPISLNKKGHLKDAVEEH